MSSLIQTYASDDDDDDGKDDVDFVGAVLDGRRRASCRVLRQQLDRRGICVDAYYYYFRTCGNDHMT